MSHRVESPEIWIVGSRSSEDLSVVDGLGGGRRLELTLGSRLLTDEVAEFIRDRAEEIAEYIVHELVGAGSETPT